MRIKGLTAQTIKEIAALHGFRLDNVRQIGNFVAFVLRHAAPLPTRSERRWLDKRKLGSDMQRFAGAAVCFHGHKVFMDAIFERNPDAIIVTCVVRYEGKEDFDRKWVSAGMRPNIATAGPAFHGNQYREMCNCYGA